MEIITSALLNAVGLFVALSGIGGEVPTSVAVSNQASVEVGLAEVSPLGEAGGYAMPASEESDPRPTATIQVRNATRGQDWTTSNINIAPEDQISLKWSSNRTSRCVPIHHAEDDQFDTGNQTSGTDTSINEPRPGQTEMYGIRCPEQGGGGRTGEDQLTVRAFDAYLDFEARNMDVSNPTWKDGVLTVDPGNSVQVRWKATPNDTAKRCNPEEGSGFETGGEIQGSDGINIPSAGQERDFTIRCLYEPSNIEVVRTITIKVRETPEPPRAVLERLRIIGGNASGGWQTGDVNLNAGEEVQIRWDWDRNYGRPTTCESTSGSGFSTGNAISGTDTSINEPALGSDQQYTVRCTNAGGSDSDSLRVFMKEAPQPSAKLELSHRNSSGGWTDWTTGNVEVELDVDVRVRWEGKNAVRCDAMAGNGFSTGGAVGPQTDETINEPGSNASMQLTVRCENIAGERVSDSSTITVVRIPPPEPLSVTLSARNETNIGEWEDDALTVRADKTVRLKWLAENGVGAVRCEAVPVDGTGFSTNPSNGPSGEDNVTTPAAGQSVTFKVRCTDTGNNVDTDTVIVTARDAEAPTAFLLMSKNGGSTFPSANLSDVPFGTQVYVKWGTVEDDADSCEVTGGSGSGFATGNAKSGTDPSITEPNAGGSQRFAVRCRNAVGWSNVAEGTLTMRDEDDGPTPTATLKMWNITDGESVGSASPLDRSIDSGDQIGLVWTSTDATSCVGAQNFSTGNNTPASGNTTNVTEPVSGSTTYTVECSNRTRSDTDSLRVTVGNGVQDPTIEVDDETVRRGDSVVVTWNPNNNTGCTVTGPNLSRTGVSTSGSAPVVINGESTFVINCAGRTDEVTVRIDPLIKES